MGPWDSKLRWQPGGNFQPTRLTCEFNWKECPYAIGRYVWSEIYTDVAEFLSNNNEDLLLKGSLLFVISIIVYSIIYWKIRRVKEKKINISILNKIAFDIQDLELRMDMLSYKLQHGTWPSLQQITNVYEIKELNKDKVRLSASTTDSSKSNKNLWLQKFCTNNCLRIPASCYLFGRSPSKGDDLQSFKDSQTLPKTCGNINFGGQKDDESVKEIQIMSNNFFHKTDDNENDLEKVNVSNNAKEDLTIKALNENNKNKEEIENKNEKLLGVHESQKNIKNACKIKENSDLVYKNNDGIRITVEEKQKDGKENIKKTGHEEQNYSRKYKNVSNNLNSSVELNGTLQIVEENSAVFSASESVVPQLEEHSLNNSKVFSEPEIVLNPPSLNNLPTIDSTLKSTKPRREKVAKKSLEDVKKRLENLYSILKRYENRQEFNSTELNEEDVAKKLLAHTFIQELSDFSMGSESETDEISNIYFKKKYSPTINLFNQLNYSIFERNDNAKEENYGSSCIADDSESYRSNQTEKLEVTKKYPEDNKLAFNEVSGENKYNSLMVEQHLMKLKTENSIQSNENLMRSDKPLIELQEDQSLEKESKFNESYEFFINSKGLYQSNLSDIISESEQIEETDGIDDHNESTIIFNNSKINFYHENDDNLKSQNIWGQTIIDIDIKSVENCQKISENYKQDTDQLIDTLDSDSSSNKKASGFFQTVTENYADEAQISRNQFESFKNLEDIFINLENSNAFRDNLIDLSDDEPEKNHDMTNKDQCHKDERYDGIEESHLQITDNIKVFENLNSVDTTILEVPNINKNAITNNNVGIKEKNYLISGKTFIKESIKKTLEHNFEDKSLIDFHSINLSSEHQISYDQYGINMIGNIENTFKEINSEDNLNPISVLTRENVVELKDKVMFDEKSDAENSEIILNKLLIKNNCENLSEIEFDIGLEMQEHSKSEYEKNPSLNTLSKSSSLYLTGEGSLTDISNEKLTDLIKLNSNDRESEITSRYYRNEKQEAQENKKKEDDEERITIASKDSAFYGTPQSSVMTINNTNVGNNNEQLDVNISNDNFNYHQCCFKKDSPQNKLKSSKKRSKLSDKRINHFSTYPNIKSKNSLKKDVKGSKQKPTEKNKCNNNLHKSKTSTQNDAKTTLNDLKTNKLLLKAKSNLNPPNDCGQDLKKKSLEGRSKSYITPRKPDSTPRNVCNSLVNNKHQRNHSSVDRTLEKNSESSRLNLHERKSTISRKLDLDSKSRSRESINKSWKSNIPILKSRIELSKDKNITNNSIKNFSIRKSSQFGDTEDILFCIESNKNIQSHQNNISNKHCIGLCKKFYQASSNCREVCVQEKNTLRKDLEIGQNNNSSLLL